MFYFMEDYKEKMFLEIMCKRMGCLPVILMFVLLSVVGCKTIKDSELIEIHDTVTVHHFGHLEGIHLQTPTRYSARIPQ